MKKVMLTAAVLFFIASTYYTIGGRFLNFDSSRKPTELQLRRAAIDLFPEKWIFIERENKVSKLKMTFIGYSVERIVSSEPNKFGAKYDAYFYARGIIEKEDFSGDSHYRKIFCVDSMAIIIEINSAGNGQSYVETGAYWSGDRKSFRYCRSNNDGILKGDRL